ncbi:hypothetical protein ACPXB5_11215 [Micromonospora arida]|uniref:hypothetical protein n=1 Tax=Micromonospora arida TaxID=2203715 RepID=UPI003CF46A0A
MGTEIFEHTDSDGDRLVIETETGAGADVVLFAETLNTYADNSGAHLTREAVDRLRAALAPYGTKSEPVNPADIVEGREYRLLPGAETLPGTPSSAVADGVTRVRVVSPDSGYDSETVRVRGLDGRGTSVGGTEYIVHQRFLAALPTEAPKPALKAGDKATVTGDSAGWVHEFATGTVVTLLSPVEPGMYAGTVGGPDGWRCVAADGETWDVHTKDLAPLATEAPAVPAEITPASPLNAAHLAAWEKASELLRGNHTADAGDVQNLAEFLIREWV